MYTSQSHIVHVLLVSYWLQRFHCKKRVHGKVVVGSTSYTHGIALAWDGKRSLIHAQILHIHLLHPYTCGPCRFMIGTEDGCILSCNKAKGQGDRISASMDGRLMSYPFEPLNGH